MGGELLLQGLIQQIAMYLASSQTGRSIEIAFYFQQVDGIFPKFAALIKSQYDRYKSSDGRRINQ
jgi:hypothetical protein